MHGECLDTNQTYRSYFVFKVFFEANTRIDLERRALHQVFATVVWDFSQNFLTAILTELIRFSISSYRPVVLLM